MYQFTTFPDYGLVDGQIAVVEPTKSDVVEVPPCGFWTVTWSAEHPQRGRESGTMLVAREDSDGQRREDYARNIVCEILWGRGFVGTYDANVVEGAS